MWHPDWAAVSNISSFAALQILRAPFLETWRRLNRSSRSRRVWDVKPSGLQTRWRAALLFTDVAYGNAGKPPKADYC
jgi:hypothetical protein